ncbi:MAG: hypothetical protein EB116_18900 [Betaproteobacteria bacterium]|nr:hypothetical protein [Betaproteobacteria bacterium]
MAEAIGSAIVGGMSDIDIAFTEDAREYAVLMIQEKRAWSALRAYEADCEGIGAGRYETDATYSALVDAWEALDDAERALRKKMIADYSGIV